MNLSVIWFNPDHFLLLNRTVTLTVDGVSVPAVMSRGKAEFVVPRGSASPPVATLSIRFVADFMGPAIETLHIVQKFALWPRGAPGKGGPTPTSYVVQSAGGLPSVEQADLHPLLENDGVLNLWWVRVNTNTVDVTALQPLLINTLNILTRPKQLSSVRVLARTDGKLPFHWITATPPGCAGFPSTDILCFLNAPQTSPPDFDDTDYYLILKRFNRLAHWLGVFLGEGLHNDTFDVNMRDHFARAHNPADPHWKNKLHPNPVIARGWESALMESGKHVALVIPVPSAGHHSTSAMATMPSLLREVFAALVATGDIAAPPSEAIDRQPRLGIAAHSMGGLALFDVVSKFPTSFHEIWLFEALQATQIVARTGITPDVNVLLAGFQKGTVDGPWDAAKKVFGTRARHLPANESSSTASPSTLVHSSEKLKHALEGGGMVSPPAEENWHGEERLDILHQQIIQGNDDDRKHYLTKALLTSVFR